ncbi:MAG: TrbC/VirB2 family protein [Rickettsiales bacterium]|nr:TrbC/VirB2 family protein [Rickettsiales bacterium]
MIKKALPLFVFAVALSVPAFAQNVNAAPLMSAAKNIIKIIQYLTYIGAALLLIWKGAELAFDRTGTSLDKIWGEVKGVAFGLALVWFATVIVNALMNLVGGGSISGL